MQLSSVTPVSSSFAAQRRVAPRRGSVQTTAASKSGKAPASKSKESFDFWSWLNDTMARDSSQYAGNEAQLKGGKDTPAAKPAAKPASKGGFFNK